MICSYILLCATDLAVIIVHYYDSLSTISNKYGDTPLKVLATRPSAFRSGIKLSWWKLILYRCKLSYGIKTENKDKTLYSKLNYVQVVI